MTGLAGPGVVAGGIWEVAANQAAALRAADYEVSIAAGWLGADPPTQIRGLPVTLVPLRPVLGRLMSLVGHGWREAVERACEQADVAHVHLRRDYPTLSATRTIARLGVPIVAQTHGMLSPFASKGSACFDRWLTAPALRRAKHFITITDAEKPALRSFGVPADLLTTIQNTVPEPPTRWTPTDAGKPKRLLFASRLHPRKQVMVFAEMVVRLRRLGHTVEGIVAGPDQGDLPRLEEFIRRADHATFLTYLGELDRTQFTAQLATATAFVFPALEEPFGLVLLEALAVGTPVVSTSETPLASALSEAGAAVVTLPEVGALTAAVAQVLAAPGLQESLSHNGRALYRSRWTNTTMVDELSLVYARSSTSSTPR